MKKIILLFFLFLNSLHSISYPDQSGYYGSGYYVIDPSAPWASHDSSRPCDYNFVGYLPFQGTRLFVQYSGGGVPNTLNDCYTREAYFLLQSSCNFPQVYNKSGSCVTCSSPNTIDPKTKLCVAPPDPTCPPNMEKSVSGDYCVPVTCPLGTVKAPSTGFCIPKTCPQGQTLISDGTCQTTCPPNSARVGKICKKTCSAYPQDTCGNFLNYDGKKCTWDYFSPYSFGGGIGSCQTEDKTAQDMLDNIPFAPGNLGKYAPIPNLPEFTPQPLQKPIPANDPNYVPIPKPANNPDYVPPVVPKPVEPIQPKQVPFFPINPNDPNYVPDPVTPLPISPNIPPYSPPAAAPAPQPLPAPETLPLPSPSTSPDGRQIAIPVLPSTPASGSLDGSSPVTNPNYSPPPYFNPVPPPHPDGETYYGGTPAPIEYPETSMPDVPDLDYFTLDDLDKFRYDASVMSDNFLSQISNAQTTFTNTFNVLNDGFEPINLPVGGCGGGLSFSALGKTIDLCPPMTSALSQFSPLFQLITFLIGFIISIRIFLSGLRD